MARFVFALILTATILTQATILPGVNPLNVLPNLVLVMLFIWSSLRGAREGLFWAFGAGLVLDTLSLDPLGSNGLALIVVVVLAVPARRRVFHSGVVIPTLLVMVATVAHALTLDVIRGVVPGYQLIFQVLLHALLVPPIYLFVGAMDRWVVQDAGR
ncbi:MAG: rod shape-determining protein MreD [Chloroflexia bacterium]|nr:rod shape-determining protein MreD [Chloroflexia bacterium]